ncbi:hypothetical protein [Archangium violaceum]|uniref:DUF1643 domain-containing protein n=1 Tax=Archangium violaceum Cb vi76 TaxID=1406225 RepID=A0A084T121_9BACT|nr:hypothetical protein [Archangium violaceum]KFA94406.1 hypothetical protein Q664_03010 [Archangium violaceum Cb vi76]
MNPGASEPRNPADAENHIRIVTHACQIPRQAVWLPTIPDATQAQTVLLMDALDCCRAVVVNLSDVCEVDSNKLCSRVNALTNNTPPWDSLFHAERHAELRKLEANGPYAAMIGGWGTLSPKQGCLRDAAVKARHHFRNIVGKPPKRSFQNQGLCHPRPTPNCWPKPDYYVDWRKTVASKLNLPQRVQTALGTMRRMDKLVDKDHIWTPARSDSLSIDLGE